MGTMAKRAVGPNCLTVRVDMPNLYHPGIKKECTAREAERHPQPM